jgi:hypothetical protein
MSLEHRWTGCQYLILGTFFDAGGPDSTKVVANARILDLDTGKSIVAQRMEIAKIPPVQADTKN